MDKDESTRKTVSRKFSVYFMKIKLLNQERSLIMTTFMRNVNRYLSEMQIKPSYLSMVSGINETKLNGLLNGLQDADESEMVRIAQGLGKDVHFFMADTINISSISRFDETKYFFSINY